MDFAALPPEINSGRMYSGAGAGPMLAAATAWDALATELQAMGSGYESTVSELTNGWTGPSATAMGAAATPYVVWLHATAAQAEQTASQAKAAVAAYEAAFAMTVPPAVIAANRSQLMALLATNFLGQNTPAIAATEALYAEMWAQDATAMYGYAGSAATASQLTPFTQPPKTTTPTGAANQAGAVGQAAATATGNHAQSLGSALSQVLQGLTTPAASTPAPDGSAALMAGLAASSAAPATELGISLSEIFIDGIGSFGIDVLGTFLIDALGAVEYGAELFGPIPIFSSLVTPAASMGEAVLLGGLSVPQAWTVAAKTVVQQVGSAMPAAGASATAITAGESMMPFAAIAGAGLAGRAAGTAGRGRTTAETTNRQRRQPNQSPRKSRLGHRPIMGIDLELRELAELRDAGVLTAEEYAKQKRRLRSPAL